MKTVFRLLITALLIALTGLFFSCDIYKKSAKEKKDVDFTEQIETKTYRKGDTVVFLPNIRYKDTTIYTYNRQGTTLKTVYDQSGQVKQVDCYSSVIETLINENRRLQDNSKIKGSEKKEEFNSSVFLYFFGALVLIICFGFFLFFLYIRKQTAVINSVLAKINNL